MILESFAKESENQVALMTDTFKVIVTKDPSFVSEVPSNIDVVALNASSTTMPSIDPGYYPLASVIVNIEAGIADCFNYGQETNMFTFSDSDECLALAGRTFTIDTMLSNENLDET